MYAYDRRSSVDEDASHGQQSCAVRGRELLKKSGFRSRGRREIPYRLERRSQEQRELRERVLRRDGWRCQFCGSMTNLEVHHQEFRSHSGEDTEDNLVTLYSQCHSTAHSQ